MTTSKRRRRGIALLAGVVTAALALSGCAGGSSNTSDASVSEAAQASSAPASATAAFPVTIDTAYGPITVAKKPERIVALTGRHVELLDLLGETPVAFTDYGGTNDELLEAYPWMAGTLPGEADPALFTADFLPSAEAIAAVKPDLILSSIWQTDEPLYAQLSQIAPTFVGTQTDSNTTWQEDLTALAKLTGHDPAIVEQTQAEVDAKLAAAAAQVPGLKGKTFYVAALGEGGAGDQLSLYNAAAPELIAMGLTPGAGQPVNGSENTDAKSFSQENVDQLNADVLLIATEHRDPDGAIKAKLQADPRVAELPATKNGTLIYLNTPQWNAVNGGSAASTIWWVDQVVPALAASALNQNGQ